MKSRSFISILHIFILSGLLLFMTQPVSNIYAAGNTPALPISKLLNTDGTLNLATGYSGVVDAGNYSVRLDPAHGPVFSPLMTVNAWNSLGGGLNNIVYAIAINGSNVYMGGQFTDAGGNTNADRIAVWDGSSWSALGSGISNGQVNALTFNGSVLYVGGIFTNAGGVSGANYIAQWDGSSWSTLGDGVGNAVNAIGVSGLNIYIAGNFVNAGVDVNADYIAKLDGGTWAALGATPLTGPVNTIAVAGASVYAGGDFIDVGGNVNIDRIALWDGTSWSPLGSGMGATVVSIALSGTDVYAGGLFSDAGGNSNADKIAKWDGTAWSALGSGLNSFVNNVVISGSNIYAGGNFLNAGGDANADRIAKWDGSAWSALGTAPLDNTVSAIAINELDVYVGGIFNDAGGDSSGDKIALFQLDGTAPTVSSFTATSPANSLNIPITAFTASDNVGVTGYKITEDNTPPAASDAGWTASSPSTYSVASNGSYSLYPWVKDGMGNISAVYGSPANVTVDETKPTVNSFSAPSSSTSLTIAITAFTASDNVAVTGYLITASSTPPSAGAGGWAASAPTTYTVGSSGSYTLYPWVKDAAGNVSAVYGSPTSVTVDTVKPTVNSFTASSPSASLDIFITVFTASDNVAVTDYKITTSSTPPSAGAAGWTASAPTTYTVTSSGEYTLYPWAKDALGNVSAVYGSPASVNVDNTAPNVVSIERANTSPTNTASVDFTVTFSESVTGADTGDFSLVMNGVSGASISGVTGSGTTRTVSVNTGSGDGSIRLDLLNNNSIQDSAGNSLSSSFTSGESYTLDKTAPTVVSSVRASTNPTGDASVNFTVTFSESVTGVDTGDFSLVMNGVSGASISEVTGSGATRTVSVNTGSGDGSIRLDLLNNNSIQDSAGNSLSGSFTSGQSYTLDKTAPTVTAFSVPSASTSLNIPITTFSASDNIGVTDYLITESSLPPSAGAAGWTASASSTYTVSSDGSYTLYPWAKDATGNVSALYGSPANVTVDTAAPTVLSFARQSPSGSPTNVNTLIFRVTFSEVVSGVGLADFALSGTTAGLDDFSTVSASVYDIEVNGTDSANDGDLVSYNGVVGLNFSGGMSITDLTGNPLANTEPAIDETYTLDNTAPGITINNPDTSAATSKTITANASDGTLTMSITTGSTCDGTLTFIAYSSQTFSTEADNGKKVCYKAVDAVGNTAYSLSDAIAGIETTTTAPVVLSITRVNPDPTTLTSVDFTVTFSEPVTGVDVNDFALTSSGLTNASISTVSGSGASYTVTAATGYKPGTLRLDIPNTATITDLSSNSLAGLPFTTGEAYTVNKSPIFSDVPFDYWSWQYIESILNAGITGGCSTNPLSFCPTQSVTRAQMAVFILKGIHGQSFTPPAVNVSTGFTDVATDYWAAVWIKQLAAEGITGGCGNGNYCPENTVTRDQMAVFLLKAKYGSSYAPPAITDTGFTDVPADYWAAAWIKQLAAETITGGCGGGNYCPSNPVTRDQMAVFLQKTFGLPLP